EVVGPQPWLAGAAPERRLVDGGREPAGRQGGQHARVAWPGDVDELARGAAHARDFEMTAESREWPIERAREPGPAVLVASNRGAAPLVGAVEKPDAGKTERDGDRFEVGDVEGMRALEPAARQRVHGGKQHARPARQPGHTIIPQRARPCTRVDRVAN